MSNPRMILAAAATIAGTAGALSIISSEVRFRLTLADRKKRFDAYFAASDELRALGSEAFELYITAADLSSEEARRAYELDKRALAIFDAGLSRFRDLCASA
ncbi:hypothetical protein [Tsukamurella ocularis]|uniref:hypothetical protein n=1 Tax=Tsukamurella ocularis TaxID=1970234 RepID=UPI00216AA555|nr:hypothetical protein [Tsukamurella ocularis]MCS3853269.1 hypothetical protein [Tsukamurella ocularis]